MRQTRRGRVITERGHVGLYRAAGRFLVVVSGAIVFDGRSLWHALRAFGAWL